MRQDCAEPGLSEAFIDITTTGWTRKQVETVRSGESAGGWFAVLQEKTAAVYLPVLEGEAVRLPADLTADALDRLDYVLYQWLVSAITEALRDVITLGNAPWLRLSQKREASAATSKGEK